jgi:histidinol-phosphate aminotransferase
MGTLEDLVPEAIRALRKFDAAQPGEARIVLDRNELPWSIEPDMAEALAAHLATVPIHRYGDPEHGELRAIVARQVGVAPDQLLFGNGSHELIPLIVAAYARPREGAAKPRVLYPLPSFVVYRIAAITHGEPVEVPLLADFSLDGSALDAAFERTRPNVAFFGWPNNPTGTLSPRAELERLVEKYPDTLFVSDEAYGDYGGGTMADLLPRHRNLLVLRTFSKLGLAALRIGFAVAAPEILAPIDKLRPTFNIGGLNQAAAAFLLSRYGDRLRARIATLISERTRVERELAAMPGLHVFPSHANFILYRCGVPGDGRATRIWHHLVEQGIVVRNCDAPGALLGCLRMTIGSIDENSQFLAAMRSAP